MNKLPIAVILAISALSIVAALYLKQAYKPETTPVERVPTPQQNEWSNQ